MKPSPLNILTFLKNKKEIVYDFTFLHNNHHFHQKLEIPAVGITKLNSLAKEIIDKLLVSSANMGLACSSLPQFNQLYSVIAILNHKKLISGKWMLYDNIFPQDYELLINPSLISQSSLVSYDVEISPNFDSYQTIILRPDKVQVEYLREMVGVRQEIYQGFRARLVQHQMDLLKGTVIYDSKIPEGFSDISNEHTSFFNSYASEQRYWESSCELTYTEYHKSRVTKSMNILDQLFGPFPNKNAI